MKTQSFEGHVELLPSNDFHFLSLLTNRVDEVIVINVNGVETVRRLSDDFGNAGDVLVNSRRS